MFDSRPGPSEEGSPASRRLLTEEDVKAFVDGPWPVRSDDVEYTQASDLSEDDEPPPTKRRRGMGGWSEDPLAAFVPGTHFLEAAGAEPHPADTVAPFLETVLPPPLVTKMIACTNQSAEILRLLQTRAFLYGQWKPLTEPEFRVFLGLLFHMEDVKMARVSYYWRKSRLFGIPIFENMMDKNRFLGILGALSFNVLVPPPDESVLKADPLYKVRPLVDHFNNLISSLHCPGFPSIESSLRQFKDNPLFSSYVWYKRVGIYILHMLLEVACLFFNDEFSHRKISSEQFRLRVVDSLLPLVPLSSEAGQVMNFSPDKPHYMSYIGINEKGKKRRKRCKFCMDVNNKRKESYFCCSGCPNHPGFCIDGCFAKFHGYC